MKIFNKFYISSSEK